MSQGFPQRGRESGVTVVELLVASTILIVVLAIVSIFFAQQTRMQRNTQARNELQDRVRVAMQLVSQDLALAGNSAVIGAGGAKTAANWPACFDGGRGCLVVGSNGTELSVRYLSSQFPVAESCRDVSYRLTEDGVLERSDVPCTEAANFASLAPNVVDFEVEVVCSNGTRSTVFPVGSCPTGDAYGRSATVTIVGQSRSPMDSPSVPGCPEDRFCFEMIQEALIPNMKDQ